MGSQNMADRYMRIVDHKDPTIAVVALKVGLRILYNKQGRKRGDRGDHRDYETELHVRVSNTTGIYEEDQLDHLRDLLNNRTNFRFKLLSLRQYIPSTYFRLLKGPRTDLQELYISEEGVRAEELPLPCLFKMQKDPRLRSYFLVMSHAVEGYHMKCTTTQCAIDRDTLRAERDELGAERDELGAEVNERQAIIDAIIAENDYCKNAIDAAHDEILALRAERDALRAELSLPAVQRFSSSLRDLALHRLAERRQKVRVARQPRARSFFRSAMLMVVGFLLAALVSLLAHVST